MLWFLKGLFSGFSTNVIDPDIDETVIMYSYRLVTVHSQHGRVDHYFESVKTLEELEEELKSIVNTHDAMQSANFGPSVIWFEGMCIVPEHYSLLRIKQD